jgi:hypothetical protein
MRCLAEFVKIYLMLLQFKERFLILLWTMSSRDSEEAGIEMA